MPIIGNQVLLLCHKTALDRDPFYKSDDSVMDFLITIFRHFENSWKTAVLRKINEIMHFFTQCLTKTHLG